MKQFDELDRKILWVIGSIQRLSTLGIFGDNFPINLSSDAIDFYLELDESRYELFIDPDDMLNVFQNVLSANEIGRAHV